MIRDRDRIYGIVVTRRLRAMGIRDKPTAPASPWQNGFAERLIGSIRRECLDHVIVLGEAHLRRILKSYARYYNETRTHLALDKDAPPIAHRKEGRAYSLPPGPRRIASRICPGLISDRHKGESIRPIGLPVVEYLERRRTDDVGTFVSPGQGEENAFGSFPSHWKHIFENSPLSDVTSHVLRHSFASIANDLGFTEVTIAALVGHAKGSVTSKYIHTLDTALIMAADRLHSRPA